MYSLIHEKARHIERRTGRVKGAGSDEYKRIEYNMILNASIDYYQNKSVTINKLESPLSMALFKEKLEASTKINHA